MAPATATYCFISLPNDESTSLVNTIGKDGDCQSFSVPSFKLGTLDALVQHADDLAKLDTACENLLGKVSESLRALLNDDQDKIAQQKVVNDKPTEDYLRHFEWTNVRYRTKQPIGELVGSLQKDLATIDNDMKAKLNQYNSVKTNLATLQRKQTGNLATKSLTPIVDPSVLIQESEYLETHFIAVPTNAKKDFLKAYETLAPMVVPRSALQIAQDDEFTLFAVTTFKKHSAEFQQKCRENKWTPRPYTHVEGGREEEERELDSVVKEEKKVWGEAVRMCRTGWSEGVLIWTHVLTLRIFVESALRYGLPLAFTTSLVVTKAAKKIKKSLDSAYSHLGGNAIGKDDVSSELAAAAGLGEGTYNAYVYYEMRL